MRRLAEEREAKDKEIAAMKAEVDAFKAEKRARIEAELESRRAVVAGALRGNGESDPGLWDYQSAEFPLPPKEKLAEIFSELTKGPEDGPVSGENALQLVSVINSVKKDSRFIKQQYNAAIKERDEARAELVKKEEQMAILTANAAKFDESFTVLNSKEDRSRKRPASAVSTTTTILNSAAGSSAATSTHENDAPSIPSFRERFSMSLENMEDNIIRGCVTNTAGSKIKYSKATPGADAPIQLGSFGALFGKALSEPAYFIPRQNAVKADL